MHPSLIACSVRSCSEPIHTLRSSNSKHLASGRYGLCEWHYRWLKKLEHIGWPNPVAALRELEKRAGRLLPSAFHLIPSRPGEFEIIKGPDPLTRAERRRTLSTWKTHTKKRQQ